MNTPSTSHSFRRLARVIAGLVVTAALVVPAAARADEVRFYEHINQQGNSFVPATSTPDFRWFTLNPCGLMESCKTFNDRVSSVHIPAYTCVALYSDISYGGSSRIFCGSNRLPDGAAQNYNLVDGWNDRASSSQTWEQVLDW